MSQSTEKVALFFKMLSAFTDTPVSAENYELGIPVDYVSPTVNTSILIKPRVSSSEYFERQLGYNRASLDVYGRIGVYKNTATDLHGLISQINSEPLFLITIKEQSYSDYSSVSGQIYPDDVINVAIPDFGRNNYIDIPMVAAADSLFIKGSAIVRVFKQ